MIGAFDGIQFHLDYLMVQGPPRGYFPEPNKSALVMSLWNVSRSEAFFWGYELQIVTGSQYLGGLSRTEIEQVWWLE